MGATTYYHTENQTVQWDKKKSQAGKIAQNVKTVATKPGDWVLSLGYLPQHGRRKWTLESSSDLHTVTMVEISISSGHYFWDCCEGAGLVRDRVEKWKWSKIMGEEH